MSTILLSCLSPWVICGCDSLSAEDAGQVFGAAQSVVVDAVLAAPEGTAPRTLPCPEGGELTISGDATQVPFWVDAQLVDCAAYGYALDGALQVFAELLEDERVRLSWDGTIESEGRVVNSCIVKATLTATRESVDGTGSICGQAASAVAPSVVGARDFEFVRILDERSAPQ